MTEKYQSQKKKKKKLSPLKIGLLISLLLVVLLAIKIALILTAKPTISIDYVALWNKTSKPKH